MHVQVEGSFITTVQSVSMTGKHYTDLKQRFIRQVSIVTG